MQRGGDADVACRIAAVTMKEARDGYGARGYCSGDAAGLRRRQARYSRIFFRHASEITQKDAAHAAE